MGTAGNGWGDPITDARKAELTERLRRWEQARAHGGRDGPFTRVSLTGADLHWLAQAPSIEHPPLPRDARNWQGAYLSGAELQGASLRGAQLHGADLRSATLDSQTDLTRVRFGDDELGWARLADVRWGGTDLTTITWQDVHTLGDDPDEQHRRKPTPDTKQSERLTPHQRHLLAHREAVRAHRQLATALRAQGLHEHAARFAYRARVLQRRALGYERRVRMDELATQWHRAWHLAQHYARRQRCVRYRRRLCVLALALLCRSADVLAVWLRFLWAWVPSLALALVSGYGYRLWRSIARYLVVVLAFAAADFGVRTSLSPPLDWWGAVTLSVLSFHGRGIYAISVSPNDLISRLSAAEAAIGLLLEVVFIATFTQRVFRD